MKGGKKDHQRKEMSHMMNVLLSSFGERLFGNIGNSATVVTDNEDLNPERLRKENMDNVCPQMGQICFQT